MLFGKATIIHSPNVSSRTLQTLCSSPRLCPIPPPGPTTTLPELVFWWFCGGHMKDRKFRATGAGSRRGDALSQGEKGCVGV